MKKGYIFAAILAVGFLVLGVTAFRTTLTPYVTFDVAMKTAGSVQVMGSLEKGSEKYDESSQELAFSIIDEHGRTLPVVYRGIKPANFRDALSIVAIGRYQSGALHAEKLLVKCPSKYQGQETERQYGVKS
ncbi:MAG TPA: cytochrome c maturation protein CcmE [Thermoanaerobaculia bacterium]|jgi:cytochrome c-type biogenesis protein CcmE|nr:cytochrome c maturation protein CcmE [Thermoanaerobaculia bacterium]